MNDTAVDVTTLLTQIILAAGTILVPVVAYLLRRYVGLKLDDASRTTLQEAILWGANRAVGVVRDKQVGRFATNSALIGETIEYIKAAAPQALQRAGIDITSDVGRAALAEKIAARLSALDPGTPAVVPGTPPAPPQNGATP